MEALSAAFSPGIPPGCLPPDKVQVHLCLTWEYPGFSRPGLWLFMAKLRDLFSQSFVSIWVSVVLHRAPESAEKCGGLKRIKSQPQSWSNSILGKAQVIAHSPPPFDPQHLHMVPQAHQD